MAFLSGLSPVGDRGAEEDVYFFIEIGSCLVLAILRLSLVQFQFCVIINNMKAEVQTIYL